MDFAFTERMLGALAVLVAVLFALQFVARAGLRARLSSGSAGRVVRVLETTFLPNQATLNVVKIGEKYYVVGQSGAHIELLCEVPPASIDAWLAAQPASPLGSAPLAAWMARVRRRGT
jgi:flagellar biogenesis protein FliO